MSLLLLFNQDTVTSNEPAPVAPISGPDYIDRPEPDTTLEARELFDLAMAIITSGILDTA